MAVDGKLQMDHDAMRAVAQDVADLAVALEGVQRYLTGGELKQEHLGGHPSAPGAFQAFNGSLQKLNASVGKAHGFLIEASHKLTQSSEMTNATDVNNAWGLEKSGEGI
jgi:uncharacterized protein YukE